MEGQISIENDRGFALAALIIFLTALSISLAVAVPPYQMQAQRELEQELIFRGEEYVRAIQKYQRTYGIFPPNVDALLNTNGIRYLRRPYTDPITDEDFRLLTVNPDGTINGSLIYQESTGQEALLQDGRPQIFGQGQASQLFETQEPVAFFGTVSPGVPQEQQGQGTRGRGGRQQGREPPNGFEEFQSGTTTMNTRGSGFGNTNVSIGGVVGVAPINENPSLIAYNRRGLYNEWEFIALPGFGSVTAVSTESGSVSLSGSGVQDSFGSSQSFPFGQDLDAGNSPTQLGPP